MKLRAPFDLDTVTTTTPKAYERIPVGDTGRISLQYSPTTHYYYATAYQHNGYCYEAVAEVDPTPNRYRAISAAYHALNA